MSSPARTTRRFTRALGAATLALGLIAGGAALTAPAAQAAVAKTFISTPNGMAGVTQQIVVKAPKSKGQAVTVTATSGALTVTLQTVVNAQGFGSIAWTPSAAGTWTIAGVGAIASTAASTVAVAALPTTTMLMAPNLIQSGASSSLVAVVSAPLGSLAPAGSVTFATGFGQTIGTAGLAASGALQSTATLAWNPPTGSSVPVIATYTPSSTNWTGSTSNVATPDITSAVPTVALRFAPTLSAGVPTPLTAVLGNGVGAGSVAFTVDGTGWAGSVPIAANGTASVSWTPTAGQHTLAVAYSSNAIANGYSAQSGVSSQWVYVVGAPTTDAITLTGAVGPWSTTSAVQVGTTQILTGSATSGSVVLLAVNGPCIINGAAFTALSAGTCTITASSAGGNGYLPGTATYTVTASK
jgi:trimeric autotransporter adhesin